MTVRTAANSGDKPPMRSATPIALAGCPPTSPEREVWAVVQGTLELLTRLDPSGEGTPGISPE